MLPCHRWIIFVVLCLIYSSFKCQVNLNEEGTERSKINRSSLYCISVNVQI